jgi:hypothetical protein
VSGHTKTWNVDSNDAHAIDLFGQQLQWHTTGRGHAEIDDDHGVITLRIRLGVNRLANVLKEFASDQGLGVKRYITNAATRPVEMGGEGEPIHAARRARQDCGSATHTQAHTQGAERRTHALRLIMRPLGVISRVLLQGLAGRDRLNGNRLTRVHGGLRLRRKSLRDWA